MKKSNRGQVSVFLGMSLLVIISLLAFVINVGLFVKAKINLQNAVDAAAYAGAAAQARQLTNIGYLNYELRNNYKEWLYKYYVVGQIANENASGNGANGETKEFRASSIPATLASDPDAYDKFNVPRVCINLGTKNICQVYGVPGIPRFEASGLPVISELTNEFTNAAVAAKSENCTTRSNLNFSTTLTWTYGNGDGNSIGTELDLMSDRVGVWPKAVELGLRMRNLEAIVNRPPITEGICRNKSSSTPGCKKSITELLSEAGNTPINERPINAFMSAYRNLGGGAENINQGADHLSIKNTLLIKELRPSPMTFTRNKGLSGFLIPENATVAGDQYSSKYYLDLKIIPVNYLIYFTSFVSSSNDNEFGGGVSAEGSCSSSITGIPVPFLITGFVKNPRILTYYAVKGEAKYVGLFFPFTKTNGLTLKAYAAAKPFGGRIGPALFKISGDSIMSRNGPKRSAAYVGGVQATSDSFRPGMPIPFPKPPPGKPNLFLETENDVFGGTPDQNDEDNPIKYAIPNMMYDVVGDMASHNNAKIFFVKQTPDSSKAPTGSVNQNMNYVGLYDHAQFKRFKENSFGVTTALISKSLVKLKTPTTYEALNYLIPSVDALGEKVATVQGPQNLNFGGGTIYNLFAPLCGDNYLLKCDPVDINKAINGYLDALNAPVKVFLEALAGVAEMMNEDAENRASDPTVYEEAAYGIHPHPAAAMDPTNYKNVDCDSRDARSLANKFNYFFKGGLLDASCGILPLGNSLTEYFANNMSGTNGNTFKNFATGLDYVKPANPNLVFSAYRPGERYDVDLTSGEATHPITNQKFGNNATRNFYSTKFIAIDKLFTSGSKDGDYGKFFLYNDKIAVTQTSAALQYADEEDVISGIPQVGFHNKLEQADLREFVPMDTAF